MTFPRNLVGVLFVAIALTFVFWATLWQGGGLIGGDIYPYYLPQKSFLADELQRGEIPLWNSLAGHGYPLVAESQTGLAYPLHWPFYGLLSVNAAYSGVHLLHYVLAFCFTVMYARAITLSWRASLFAALIYTYGWFPSRACLEWAIIGGAYLPLALWSVERFLQSCRWRFLLILTTALALQMLPGHFNLAFITQLVMAVYVPARLWWANNVAESGGNGTQRERSSFACAAGCDGRLRWCALLCVGGAVALAFLLCAVQLLPTWELKLASQRASVGERHQPGYGHLPPVYLTQVIAPWHWYLLPAPVNAAQATLPALSYPAGTNEVEAHLYFGQVPLLLLIASWFWRGPLSPFSSRFRWLWGGLALAAVVYTTGWPLVVTQHLPGFSFFAGPGRFGIVTTLAVALLSAGALEGWLRRLDAGNRPAAKAGGRSWVLWTAVLLLTVGDLWIVGRLITYATQVKVAPVAFREKSWVRQTLVRETEPPRMWAPGANLPTLTGIAGTPPYLGIGPAAYFDPLLTMPENVSRETVFPQEPAPGQIEWLRRAGVTHLLRFEELDPLAWPVELVEYGADEMLNRAWARKGSEPLFLYRLKGSRGRTSFQEGDSRQSSQIELYRANRIEIAVQTPVEDTLVLTDLMFPGWSPTVDGQPASAILVDGMFRGVLVPAGEHRVVWKYAPGGVYWGASVSMATLLALLAIGVWRWFARRESRDALARGLGED